MYFVAPFAGAWIEIVSILSSSDLEKVAPFAGAWIEIKSMDVIDVVNSSSLPSRERGLKY